ncbi:DUF4230 domain-containing protein [Sphingomonas sp. 3-13AW]|jgi:hypothetical protein|uniref:DUF4230 domain-containing protein n=1 Tax=Sphingomonas sp. 3-13AW TaxID=3050450 RepID=UPI003BB60864
MATQLKPQFVRAVAVLVAGAALTLAGVLFYQRYTENYVVTEEKDGTAVTRLITARLSGASTLKVAELSGTLQSTATDVRGMGMLKSNQVIKVPFSVDYFVDVSQIGPADLQWSEGSRTLIVDAPDVTVAKPNVDESQRSLVRTQGVFVTREAGENLARRTSQAAQTKAQAEARSPERMAQAREKARAALARLLGAPLQSVGYGDARVLVTFPNERRARDNERWDVTAPIDEVLANRR